MNERSGSADEGLWMVLCVLLLLLLGGAGGLVWFKQREAARVVAAEQMAREAAEMNQMQAQMAMEHAELARHQAEALRAEAATARAAADNQASAAGQPAVPVLYLNQDLWQHVESLADAGPDERVFSLDAVSGEVQFGDGVNGAAPPAGPATIQATYETASGGTVTVSLPETDLRAGAVRAVRTPDGVLRLEVVDPQPVEAPAAK